MKTNLEKIKVDLKRLQRTGIELQLGIVKDLGNLDSIPNKEEVLETIKPIDFNRNYEQWYSEAFQVIKQLIPHRLDDFKILYKNDNRKKLEYTNYSVSDYLINVVRKIGDEIIADRSAAYPKFVQQLDILNSAENKLKSSLFDIKQIVQADLFDTELDSAKELLKKGFLRASGAIAGVLIEKHLNQVTENHNINIEKKNPSIASYNDLLKTNDVYDTPDWRFIQRLADLRNLCDHFKDREPTKEEISELLNGTDKIMKTIF
ncbi:carbohydrate kinase family protein [Aquimarina sediminis]|uniref:hypothetical protein n=1 Tax=Aquimarina sediminis TaxID=2070536 RepID=UPI000CA08FDA|nr:hypothetical protein [Aquimarina sediminis]